MTWKPIDDYCWTNGIYNIIKVGSEKGYRYEVWHVKKRLQLAVNLPNSKVALAAARDHANNTSAEGAKDTA